MEGKENLYSIPESTISWLLASETPSIRYLTLTRIIQKDLDDPFVLKTHAKIEKTAYIKAIFADQIEDGYWYSARHYYSPKFRSSHWAMYLLTELGLNPEHPRIQKGAEFMLWRMQSDENTTRGHSEISILKEGQAGFSCFWGNWLRYQIYCGNLDNPFVQQAITYVCEDIQRDGLCKHNGNLPCSWSVIRSLNGLALIPENKRDEKVRKAIAHGIDFILGNDGKNLILGEYPSRGEIHSTWKQLSFPLFYHVDVLFTLRVLAELEALEHPGARRALDWLAEKRRDDGTWRAASPFRQRTYPFLDAPDTTSHWVTMHALSVMAAANR